MSETPVVHIVGARPQFVKAAVVLAATDPATPTALVHTGQHYSPELSQMFFEDLGLPEPTTAKHRIAQYVWVLWLSNDGPA